MALSPQPQLLPIYLRQVNLPRTQHYCLFMSNHENSQPPSSTKIEIVRNQLITHWETVGEVSIHDGYKLNMPKGITQSPGVYQIMAIKSDSAYIGESQNLATRLRAYGNAGYERDRAANTDRTVQGWIYETLQDNDVSVEISVCAQAEIADGANLPITLDLRQKYFRTLVESFTIFNHRNLTLVNKQFQK